MKRNFLLLLSFVLSSFCVYAQESSSLIEWLKNAGTSYDTIGVFSWENDPLLQTPESFSTKEAFHDSPEKFGYPIQRKYSLLPVVGSAKKSPYSGHWWPMKQEGIAFRWLQGELSPLEKYAKAFDVSPAIEWEKKNHGTLGSKKPESWWGHCNGWAAASTHAQEPQKSIKHNQVVFEVGDLKALLAEVYFDCSASMVDRRAYREGTIETDKYGRPVEPEFRDLNPGVLHLLVTNMIGVHQFSFVMDFSSGAQVWNYPVDQFKVLEQKALNSKEAINRIAGREMNEERYPFNGNASSFHYVKLEVRSIDAASPSIHAQGASRTSKKQYEYILELNQQGEVIGGEWVGLSKKEHPDFAWFCLGPQSGYTLTSDGRYRMVRTRARNPYILYEDLKLLLKDAGVPPPNHTTPNHTTPNHTPPNHTPPNYSSVEHPTPTVRLNPNLQRLVQQADQLISQGEISQALPLYQEVLQQLGNEQLPEQVQLYCRRGWGYFLQGGWSESIKDYDKAIEKNEQILQTLTSKQASDLLFCNRTLRWTLRKKKFSLSGFRRSSLSSSCRCRTIEKVSSRSPLGLSGIRLGQGRRRKLGRSDLLFSFRFGTKGGSFC
jgi:tetratricopeptide (TPR) repeat protein